MYKVALIGGGNMGEAMLSGWLDAMILEKEEIIVCEKSEDKRSYLSGKYGVETGKSALETTSRAATCVLAVKPQDAGGVLDEIAEAEKQPSVLMSIVAGLSISSIRKKIRENISVVRVMPNMGARMRCSISAYSVSGTGKEFDEAEIESMLGGIGEAVKVEERFMDLVTAISGSGPAYFFYLAEAMEKAAVSHGMPKELAVKLAEETLYGSGIVLKRTDMSASELRAAVSSPGGTTLAGLKRFDDLGFEEMVGAVVDAAARRAGELSGEIDK
ncbi:MAG: pyrroline-5-carboxylate reductase [Actinobacteria bacterium]|nr:pyrroline-5-carboxylate reductase [Actinomycetota bacterium]